MNSIQNVNTPPAASEPDEVDDVVLDMASKACERTNIPNGPAKMKWCLGWASGYLSRDVEIRAHAQRHSDEVRELLAVLGPCVEWIERHHQTPGYSEVFTNALEVLARFRAKETK